MPVLVDSSVWSLALRRSAPDPTHQRALNRLIIAGDVRIIGPIRQECLSGIANLDHFQRLRDRLRGFSDVPLLRDDYELGATFYNTCRSHGIQGSHTDFLICAVANRARLSLYTTDADFARYAAHIPVKLFRP